MYILSLAIKNLLRNKRKTFVLALLITIVSLLVFVANAIFEQTNAGLRSLFTNNLTASFLISENSEKINSIFGYEMPLVSDYEPVDQLQAFLPLSEKLDSYNDVLEYTPIISAAVRLEIQKKAYTVPIFGIDAESYFEVFSNVEIPKESLNMLLPGNKGLLLNSTLTKQIENSLNRPLTIGENIQLNAYTDGSFRIRQGIYAGSFNYPSSSEPFNRIILGDPQLVRELLQYSNAVQQEVSLDTEESSLFEDSFDDLFSDFEEDVDIESTSGESILSNIDSLFAQSDEDVTDFSSVITWSFILVKEKENLNTSELENILIDKIIADTDVKLMDWSAASGLSAQAPLALQISFTIGMAFIILGSVLVIVNGLVISVLERTNEIGTMRAMGASGSFIKKLYSTEMILLILFFSALGIVLGILLCYVLTMNPIFLTNSFLVTLFGSEVLTPLVSPRLIVLQLFVSFVVAILAWQYPVRIAIRIQPAHIMGKGL